MPSDLKLIEPANEAEHGIADTNPQSGETGANTAKANAQAAKGEGRSRGPDGIVAPPRHREYSRDELRQRFVSSDTGESFDDLADDAQVVCTWRCDVGHEYTESVASHSHSRDCPTCAVSVATRMPGLLKFWDAQKNKLGAHDVSAYSRDKAHWVCEHNHHFTRPPYRVLATGHQCQECRREGHTPWRIAGKRDAGLTFAAAFPEMAAEWDYERNPRGPEEYAPGSQRVAHWICENGHSWSSPICHRTSTARHPASCQHCKAIAYSAPELAAQLHPTLNPPDTATTARKGSSEVLYWECERGHVFTASVAARLRTTYPASCDRCRAIAVKAPDLIDACWAYERNAAFDPEELKSSSSEEVWWVRMDSLKVPAAERGPQHYERKRIGYRYRRYLNNPEREGTRLRDFLRMQRALQANERAKAASSEAHPPAPLRSAESGSEEA